MRFRTTTLVRKLLAPGATGRTPQRWASLASWGCLVSVLPSIGWRVAMLAGADTGFALAPLFRSDPEAIRYVLTLDVLQLGGAIACVGLARRWGERWFSWLPVIGGRVIPRLGPVALAGVADLVLHGLFATLTVSFLGRWLGLTTAWTPADGMTLAQRLLLAACYLPLLAWPSLLTVAIIGYWRRRRPTGSATAPTPSAPARTPSATSPTLTGLAPTMRVSTPTERPADADPDSSPALVRRRATAPGTR